MNTSEQDIKISTIIPAFNEEEHIANTINALKSFAPEGTEIIVVDNGSTDQTPKIAEELGAQVIIKTDSSIAGLRNAGVERCSGEILVFIDADVSVTQEWGAFFSSQTIHNLKSNPIQITGSRCLAPQNDELLNKHWFSLLTSYEAPYINSGHLITTRELFNKINGFSAELKTAEDYDFCMKAKAAGASLINEPKLPVIHYGYPNTYEGFIRRERWHGKEDFQSWKSFLSSKVAIAATGNLLLGLAAIINSLISASIKPILSYAIVMTVISIALSLYKFDKNKITSLAKTAFVFYLYLCGRSLSLVDRLRDLFKPANT